MLSALGHDSLDAMISAGVPNSIRTPEPPELPPAQSETEALESVSYTHLTLPTIYSV